MSTNLYKTTAQVTFFSTVEKTLSFIYRIVLSRTIGAEGLGIYQIALSVFSVLLTAASSGVPVTVSRLITKQNALGNTAGKSAVVTAGIVSTLLFTVPVCAIIFGGRKFSGCCFPTALPGSFSDNTARTYTHFCILGDEGRVLGRQAVYAVFAYRACRGRADGGAWLCAGSGRRKRRRRGEKGGDCRVYFLHIFLSRIAFLVLQKGRQAGESQKPVEAALILFPARDGRCAPLPR